MAAIIELTPLTKQGRELLDELESRTGLLPFKINDASGAKTYYLEGWATVDGFQATLNRLEPAWARHLTFRPLTQSG